MRLSLKAGSVLDRGSMPKFRIGPTTCAPTSTTSSGSSVPVALMVIDRSPRFTGAVRKLVGVAAPRYFV